MPDITKIPYLTILFGNRIKPYEIPAFRGAVISKVPKELVLFHNHLGEGFRFSYPLIQYKTIRDKAAIICIGEGTQEISRFFENADLTLRLGETDAVFSVENVWAGQWILQTWQDTFLYSVRNWLPLNKTNYEKYGAAEGVMDRIRILESVLTGNLLAMGKGLSHHFEKPVECTITDLSTMRQFTFKGVRLQGLDITFKTNVYLPDFIGLGKGASMGFGVVKQLKNQRTE